MPHEFEVREEITLDATPEQVWEAIATGPGVDAWFMGSNEIEPRQGGRASMTMFGETSHSTVAVWEPQKRLVTRSDASPDGIFMAFEYLIEGRDDGTTVLRFVHNGFLGDDWEAEYDALRKGDRAYLEKLAVYVRYFPGRTVTSKVFLPGPQVPDADRVWAAFGGALGLDGTPAAGDAARLTVDGLPPTEGVVETVRIPTFAITRTDDGYYMFMYGFHDTVVVEYDGFAKDPDTAQIEQAWQGWLARTFA